jgi:predicted nucleotidyltransferase
MAKGRQITVYLDKSGVTRLDHLVSTQARIDREKGLEGYDVASRSKLLSRIVNEYLDSHPQETLTVDELRAVSVELAQAYGVKKVSLFGSYARGEADLQSDVDLLVEKGQAQGLEFVSLKQDFEERLQRKVDLVTLSDLRDPIRTSALNEEVVLYEAL